MYEEIFFDYNKFENIKSMLIKEVTDVHTSLIKMGIAYAKLNSNSVWQGGANISFNELLINTSKNSDTLKKQLEFLNNYLETVIENFQKAEQNMDLK